MWKHCIPSSCLIKCVLGGVFCQSPVVIPLPGGVARYSPCGVCQEISLWNISLISIGSRIHLNCFHCSWVDSWLHFDYLVGETWWCWILRLKSGIDPSFWFSRCRSIFLLKIRYRSIFFENLIHEYLFEMMIHEYLLKLHFNSYLPWNFPTFPSFQEFLYISFSFFSLCWSHVVQLLLHQWQKPCIYDSNASTNTESAAGTTSSSSASASWSVIAWDCTTYWSQCTGDNPGSETSKSWHFTSKSGKHQRWCINSSTQYT